MIAGGAAIGFFLRGIGAEFDQRADHIIAATVHRVHQVGLSGMRAATGNRFQQINVRFPQRFERFDVPIIRRKMPPGNAYEPGSFGSAPRAIRRRASAMSDS